MDTSLRDSGLIRDCISGKEEAWHLFVNRFSRLVYFSINKAVKSYSVNLDREDIEDIYSGVFHSFIENNYRKLRQFEGKRGCTLASWLRLIAIRHTIDFLRRKKELVSIDDDAFNGRPVSETLQDDSLSIYNQMEISENEKLLKQAIEELPPSDRLFIRLYYVKELQPDKIAGIMNVSVSTVYSKKNRVREKLGKILKDKGLIA